MPPIMEISVHPFGKQGASLSDALAQVVREVEKRGLNYQITPMGTCVEGDLDTLFGLARDMHEVCFDLGYPRVHTTIRLDDRRDKDLTMQYVVDTVKTKVAQQATHIRES